MSEFNRLVDAWLDGEITEPELDQLNGYLRADYDRLREFSQEVRLHFLLRKTHRAESGLLAAVAGTLPDDDLPYCDTPRRETLFPPHFATTFAPGRRNWLSRFSRPAFVAIATAALALVGFFAFQTNEKPQADVETQPVARVIRSVDAAWQFEGQPFQLEKDTWLTHGRYTLTSGIAQLAFPRGTEVTLEGPTEIEFTVDGARRLLRGQLIAKVSPDDTGFTIDTASVEVIDLGTEFGISTTEDGRCEVHVFKGAVEARQKLGDAAPPAAPLVLPAGAATGFGAHESLGRRIAFNPKRFSKAWRMASRVVETQGMVRFNYPPPASVAEGESESNDSLLLFLESEAVRLPEATVATIVESGVYTSFIDREAWLPEGLEVDSYLLHFDPVGSQRDQAPVTIQGTVTFDRPIVGIMARGDHLAASDPACAYPGTRYASSPSWQWSDDGCFFVNRSPTCFHRGLNGLYNVEVSRESRVSPAPNDWLELSADRRTLTLKCAAGGETDQLRILVADVEGGIAAPPVPRGRSPQPYHGRPFVVGETIEAEDFDLGGQDIAYYDTTPNALANTYRINESVELGSYRHDDRTDMVVWMTRAGEWLAYTVEINEPGTYLVRARLGSGSARSRASLFGFRFGEIASTESLRVPRTQFVKGFAGFSPDRFATIESNPVRLEPGRHVLRVVMESNHEQGWVGDFDWFRIERVGESSPEPRIPAEGPATED